MATRFGGSLFLPEADKRKRKPKNKISISDIYNQK